MQVDVDNEFLIKSALAFSDNLEKHWSVRLSKLLPWLTPLLGIYKKAHFILKLCAHKLISSFPENTQQWFRTHVKDIIETRFANPVNRRVDLLQLMIDSTTDEQIDVSTETFSCDYGQSRLPLG